MEASVVGRKHNSFSGLTGGVGCFRTLSQLCKLLGQLNQNRRQLFRLRDLWGVTTFNILLDLLNLSRSSDQHLLDEERDGSVMLGLNICYTILVPFVILSCLWHGRLERRLTLGHHRCIDRRRKPPRDVVIQRR